MDSYVNVLDQVIAFSDTEHDNRARTPGPLTKKPTFEAISSPTISGYSFVGEFHFSPYVSIIVHKVKFYSWFNR